MPYVITTKRPAPSTYSASAHVDRRAVATLEEARTAAAEAVYANIGHEVNLGYKTRPLITPAFVAEARDLHDSGGTVGPLPDGTVIEVRPATNGEWSEVADELGLRIDAMYDQEFCDAYNAREARHA